jgi:hypothetical protein
LFAARVKERQEGAPHWQYFWSFEVLGLTIGVVGFTLTYLRGDDESQRFSYSTTGGPEPPSSV